MGECICRYCNSDTDELDSFISEHLDNLFKALKSTREQSTYISLENIVAEIKRAFPEEYKLIAEKLCKI